MKVLREIGDDVIPHQNRQGEISNHRENPFIFQLDDEKGENDLEIN